MGRHSRKGLQAKGPDAGRPDTEAAAGTGGAGTGGAGTGGAPGSGSGRRRWAADAPPAGDGHSSFRSVPQSRGGHPEQREPGGGWGTGPQQRYSDRPGAGRPVAEEPTPAQQAHVHAQQALARQVSAQQAALRAADRRTVARPQASSGPLIPGPRRDFVDAFDGTSPAPSAEPYGTAGDPYGPGPDDDAAARAGTSERPYGPDGSGPLEGPDDSTDSRGSRDSRGSKGRTFTGIAAAAVTTVLAVVVAGQVAQDSSGASGAAQAGGVDRDGSADASRSDERPAPQAQEAEVKPLSYEDRMAKAYPLAPALTAAGQFEAVPGLAKAPGKGHKYRYRVDIEKGLGLDAGLFAEAVQKTLNDDRSWAHNGAMTFERISSGEADFVITLASPGTTGFWCEKSGLDTTEDNVSCDSAATDRVMINAYRWAQGASTFGPEKLLAYRQMLINHEIGHRLGHNHVNCRTPGSLAPVMQQQTKTLEIGGVKCRPNAWVYPGE